MADATSVIDASALLAYLKDEPGSDVVERALIQGAAMSVANLAEVLTKLVDAGEDPREVTGALRQRGFTGRALDIIPLTEDDAYLIAEVHRKTRRLGLSLGDRACLGLSLRLGLPALTADRSWSGLKLGVRVETIR